MLHELCMNSGIAIYRQKYGVFLCLFLYFEDSKKNVLLGALYPSNKTMRYYRRICIAPLGATAKKWKNSS
jgi:hypothetical protein